MSDNTGEPIVINLEEARRKLEGQSAEAKGPDDKKQRVLRGMNAIDRILKEERLQLLINPQLQMIGSGIFKIGGALMIKAKE